MILSVKKWIFSKIQERNYDLTRGISKQRMLDFLTKIYPRKTKYDLIRMGAEADGGYLVPNNLMGISTCYSPGVSDISEFEKACMDLGMKVYMADKSVSGPNLNKNEFNYEFLKKHIGCINSDEYITMDNWIRGTTTQTESDLMLQMDIEGFEYAAIINITEEMLKKFRIIIIEFHSFESIWHPHFFNIIELTFSKILRYHSVVHIHPNNSGGSIFKNNITIPEVMEFTFLRNDSGVLGEYVTEFPHPLDRDNIKGKSLILSNDCFQSNI
ncbi:Methyltransferase FkbM domain-containing protein [Algoriphagus locisalis]|uniref:Methyltransferase FkbM domain-containing protein n=1 Tax=Algoriphagus locisalis TaxID=305507 RepID=A0A1I6XVA1_9BACT|nr:FkbM family methyltransferase [Algoriphagus locisalis]SFT41744.1 Methyltransferase FkbM domain-containing protein [Algoriphagus locisalis]